MASVEIYSGFGSTEQKGYLSPFLYLIKKMIEKVLLKYDYESSRSLYTILRGQNAENEHPIFSPRSFQCAFCIQAVLLVFLHSSHAMSPIAVLQLAQSSCLCIFSATRANQRTVPLSPQNPPVQSTVILVKQKSADKWTVPSRFIDASCQLCSHSFFLRAF